MRFAGDHVDRTGPADGLAGSVKPGERGKRGISAGVAVGIGHKRQVDTLCTHIRYSRIEVTEIAFDGKRPTADVAIAEIPGDSAQCRQLGLMARNLGSN